MTLEFEKITEDIRGKILWLTSGKTKILVIETKKGFARGGHYHNFSTKQFVAKGTIEYREEDLNTGIELIQIFTAPDIISTSPNIPHMITALEDSLSIEIFTTDYSATMFQKYRAIIENRMKPMSN